MWYVHPMSVEGSMQWRRVNQRNCCQLPWATVPKNTTPQSSPERYLEDTLSKKNCHLHTDGYTLTDGRQPHEDSPLIKCRSPSCFGIPTVVSAIFVISSYQTSTISSSTSYPAKCKMWSIAANRYQAKATLPEPCLILSWPKSWGTEVCLSGVTLSKQSSLRVDWCWVCSLTRLCIDWFGRQRSFRWVNDKKNTAWGWDDEVSSLFCKMECKEWTIDREW